MKFSIKQTVLQKLLSTTTKAISNKIIIPILSGIKFDITNSKITLTGSSNNLTITREDTDIENFSVEIEGAFVLPSRYISDIVRKTSEEWINFEMIDTNLLLVYTNKTEFNLKCFDLIEYPNAYFIENEPSFSIETQALQLIINQTVFCISQNESRPALTGLNFKISGKELVVIGSDSFRLSQKTLTMNPQNIISQNCIIPGKTAQELQKILGDVKASEIEIHVSSNKVLFMFDQIKLQTNLIDGTYPDTTRAIPEAFEIEVEISKAQLLHAVDVASLLSRDVHNNIVNLKLENNILEISSLSEEVGKVKEELPVRFIKGSKLIIAVNGQFILDALKTIPTDNIILKFNDELKPFIIETVDDRKLVQLIVPLRTH
ncbi:MAG: DNA polymerase III subunit beta [Culicoidibacterales bacterium]